MKKYQWKQKSLAKGVDPDLAIEELNRIQKKHGSLTPNVVVKESESENAVLHPIFEWNDTKAAHNYRVQQARTHVLNNIEVEVIGSGVSEFRIPNYEVVRDENNNRGYKEVSTLSLSEADQVKQQALKSLNYWSEKLKIYSKFSDVLISLNSAIDELQKTE
jgi:hypothetical protein